MIDEKTGLVERDENSTVFDEEKIKDVCVKQERERVLALIDITEDSKDLRKFVENGVDPAKAAMQVLKQIRDTRKNTTEDFPSANLLGGAGLSRAQQTINFAKKLGVI